MEEVKNKITDKILDEFSSFIKNIPIILSEPSEFFRTIENNDKTFLNASSFALVVSGLLVLLNIPSYKINGIQSDPTFYTLAIIITWLILAFIGAKLWIITKLFSGNGGFIRSISSFFYASSALVFLKFLEIPSRVGKDSELINRKNNVVIDSFPSDIYVLLGYLLFFVLMFNVTKSVHGLDNLKSTISTILFILIIILSITYMQTPIIKTLLIAYK